MSPMLVRALESAQAEWDLQAIGLPRPPELKSDIQWAAYKSQRLIGELATVLEVARTIGVVEEHEQTQKEAGQDGT